MWFENFDKIFLINLPERTDRLQQATEELNKHGIPFELVPAFKDKNGAYGLWLTMHFIFEGCNTHPYNNILILEDDIQFTKDNLHIYLDECMHDLTKVDWDLFYLGANAHGPFKFCPDYPSILQCNSLLSTHAVGYNKVARQLILEEMRKGVRQVKSQIEPYDQLLERVVQSRGKSYISTELLAVQRPSYSDILKMDIDWTPRIQDTFCKRIKEMKNGNMQ